MSRRVHPKAQRRINADPDNTVLMRRFDKVIVWFYRKEKSESNAVIWDGHNWVFTGGRNLIHNGRK